MRVLWSLAAQDDVLDIADYYDRLDSGLADELVRRIAAAPFPLTGFPRLGEAVGQDGTVEGDGAVRKRTVAGTPFVLLYVVRDDAVEVRRVVHTASNWRP